MKLKICMVLAVMILMWAMPVQAQTWVEEDCSTSARKRAAFSELLTATQKSTYWYQHLQNQAARTDISKTQKFLIEYAQGLTQPEMFMSEPNQADYETFLDSVKDNFTEADAFAVFQEVSTYEPPSSYEVSDLQSRCNCSTWWGWCRGNQYGSGLCSTGFHCNVNNNCGLFGVFECQGKCAIRMDF